MAASTSSFSSEFSPAVQADLLRVKEAEYNEPILNNTNDLTRFIIEPKKYPDLNELYRESQRSHWVESEMDFAKDRNDWNAMKPEEQMFLKNVLTFFANADGIVMENIAGRFLCEIKISESRSFYATQISIENTHGITYTNMLSEFVKDVNERMAIKQAVETDECVKGKALWAEKWLRSDLCFAARLVAFICFEGIAFSGSFCAIGYFKLSSRMHGLTFANDKIAADEALHCRHACALYNHLQTKLSDETVTEIIASAVKTEEDYILKAIPYDLLGMTPSLMTQYIRFVADVILGYLNVPKHYNVNNPFSFMNLFSLGGITSFFEKRNADYTRDCCTTDNNDYRFDADF